ncbi:hypothetical protein [uncultured Draconibacterium sp.]|uniref:hypothetical protein n=1 Tax=uncultured Draconibacterium sp. TaxID=1573823 RepID=UPI00326174DA
MKLKINITKRLMAKLALFMVVVAAAFILDVYFGNHPEELKKIQAESQEQSSDQGKVYLITQTTVNSVKILEQKASARQLKLQLHDKFLRNHHSSRNYQVLKAEVVKQTTPLILSYHYLVFQNHIFSPDEDPLA